MSATRPTNMRARALIRVLPYTSERKHEMIRPPVGHIMFPFFGETTPDGWMDCDGRLLSCDRYPDLFSVLGWTYGNAPTVQATQRLTFWQRVAIRLGLKITEPERIRIPNPNHIRGCFALPDCSGTFK